MQEDHAESNIKLKDQVRGQKLLLAIRRVLHKHTAKGFHRFADNSISKRQVIIKQRVTTESFEPRESTHMESDTLDSPSINMNPASKIGGASSARSSSRIKLRVRSTSQISDSRTDEENQSPPHSRTMEMEPEAISIDASKVTLSAFQANSPRSSGPILSNAASKVNVASLVPTAQVKKPTFSTCETQTEEKKEEPVVQVS